MFVPKVYKETNPVAMQRLIRSNPLGTWVTRKNKLEVNHIPFLLDPTKGDYGILRGHVNRANPVWRSLDECGESIIVFHGPNAYITPSWYAEKNETGKVVPTWNYLVVHAHGVPRAVDDTEWLLTHLESLSDEHEAKYDPPWQLADAPEDYIEKLRRGIVGIEIPITQLIGQWKMSQNKTAADQQQIIQGLNTSADLSANLMASAMSQQLLEEQ